MQADFPVIVDACVLAPPGVCDLFLRLAEHPRLYLPKWSDEILDELKRTQINKLHPAFSEELANFWQEEVRAAFPEARVDGFHHLVDLLENDEKDRHVLAAAVHDRICTIVTFNLKDFKKGHLEPWGVAVIHPQDFLLDLYSLNPKVVLSKISVIAEDAGRGMEDMLIQYGKTLPKFSLKIMEDIGIEPACE